jgi:hypothetical protein
MDEERRREERVISDFDIPCSIFEIPSCSQANHEPAVVTIHCVRSFRGLAAVPRDFSLTRYSSDAINPATV